MFWAYILRCADGSYYTGHTEDLEKRFAEHQHGKFLGYTHDRRPVELVARLPHARTSALGRAEDQAVVACQEGSADRRKLGHAVVLRDPSEEARATGLGFARPCPSTSLGTSG
jgi:hypothetical protein